MKEQLERFEAPTMNEALEKVRARFGNDAMILGSKKFRRGSVFGVGGRRVVEIFARDTRSKAENLRRMAAERTASLRSGSVTSTATAERDSPDSGAVLTSDAISIPVLRRASPPQYDRLSDSIGQIREDLQMLLERSGDHGAFTHPFLRECYELLMRHEVEPRIADAVVRDIANLKLPNGYPDRSSVDTVVRAQLARVFKPNPPLPAGSGTRILILIGPTGVGKTTTIAKLASRAKVHQRRKVGLITLDTFRIGAVDQLKQYAEIFKVPVQVVQDPVELEQAVGASRKAGDELVFIDSAGRSHRDELKMSELSEFLAVVPEAEVHLVLSTTTHFKTVSSIAERFAPVGFDRVILTKLDESVALGPLIGEIVDIGKPISYVTDGQNVPKDILPADPDRLVDIVMKPLVS
jgi:flagellar biosynthesis protein FlhF